MDKKKITIISAVVIGVIVIYLPGFSRLQQLKEENKILGKRIDELKKNSEELKREIHRLETDPIYVEGIAREKLKKVKKGEIIYKTE